MSVMGLSTGSIEWRRGVQKEHIRAYQKWTEQEDWVLAIRVRKGWPISKIAKQHGRRRGGIVSRINYLELDHAEIKKKAINLLKKMEEGI